MANKTYIRKGTAKGIMTSKLSYTQKHRLARAVSDLQTKDLATLIRSGKVRKLNSHMDPNVYIYRMGLNERVIFSPTSGKNVIHDIVDVRSKQSLIPNVELP